MNTNNNVEIQVLIDEKPVRKFSHDGKLFIEAKDGSEYSVKIKNNNNFKILAVVAVDGIDVQSGKIANHDGCGYVINGLSSYSVKGYRKNLNEIGAFKFVKKDKSYAQEISQGDKNCGIISVAVFAEKERLVQNPIIIKEKEYIPYPYPVWPTSKPYWDKYYFGDPVYPTWTCGEMICKNSIYNNLTNSTVFLNNSANYCQVIGDLPPASPINSSDLKQSKIEPSFDLGSTWGKKLDDRVIEVQFERGNLIGEFNILYASKESLKKMGVKMDNEAQVAFPNGFPGQFARPPSGWAT